MSQGSPIWQGAIFLAAGLFLLWEMWRGWRAGVVRSGIHLGAFVVSALVAMGTARLAAMPFGGLGEIPGFLAGMVVGGGMGLFVFLLLWFLGALLFKRTAQQSSGLFRLLWGMGGAILGLLVGLFILWSGISVVRGLGALAQARVEGPPGAAHGHPSPPPRIASGLVTLKDSLELGPAGRFVTTVDPVPADFYELILQIGKLSGDQESMVRFVEYPGIQEVIQSPRMVELLNDPAIIRASEKRDLFALMGNKALLAAVQDPAFSAQLKKIDLQAALKFALEPAPPDGEHSTPNAVPSTPKPKTKPN